MKYMIALKSEVKKKHPNLDLSTVFKRAGVEIDLPEGTKHGLLELSENQQKSLLKQGVCHVELHERKHLTQG